MRIRRKALSAAVVCFAAAGGLLYGSPASADHLPYYYHRIGGWGELSRWHTNTCGGEGLDPHYSVNWQPNGDKLFVRDCKGDGYGAKARIYYSNASSDTGAMLRTCGSAPLEDARRAYLPE